MAAFCLASKRKKSGDKSGVPAAPALGAVGWKSGVPAAPALGAVGVEVAALQINSRRIVNLLFGQVAARRGARFRDDHGWPVPDHYGSVEQEYRALKEGAGLLDLSGRGKIAATGQDRARWLHGMVTNDIQGLAPGQGTYCFVLNAQGQIQADVNVLVEPDRLLLDCEPFLTAKLLPLFDHYIIMDQVEMADLTSSLGTIGVEGPRAHEVVRAATGLEALPGKTLEHVAAGERLIIRVDRGFWIIAPVGELAALWERLEGSGAKPAGFAAQEIVRIEAGVPRYGVDIEETTLPQETGQMRALHFNKGCYIGQEIVERVRSRGHVNRMLVGLASKAALKAGSSVEAGGREAGRITSAADSPDLGCSIALAYVRREFAAPGTAVLVEGEPAEVRALPFLDLTLSGKKV